MKGAPSAPLGGHGDYSHCKKRLLPSGIPARSSLHRRLMRSVYFPVLAIMLLLGANSAFFLFKPVFFSWKNETPRIQLLSVPTAKSVFVESESGMAFNNSKFQGSLGGTIRRLSSYDTGRYIFLPEEEFAIRPAKGKLLRFLLGEFNSSLAYQAAFLDTKHFHECGTDAKRDDRFADETICPKQGNRTVFSNDPYFAMRHTKHNIAQAREVLISLLAAWSEFSRSVGAFWWIAHGGLLGWFWNGRLLPWDTDLDVQVPLQTLLRLVAYNQTVIGGRFLFDIGPSIYVRTPQVFNTIDARLVDTKSGYFIDITGIAKVHDNSELLFCKSPHGYSYSDLMPLIETSLNGVTVWRPRAAVKILAKEYREEALYTAKYKTGKGMYFFDQRNEEWRRDETDNL
ncbi:hypothetical protein HDU83_005996 [Entophlyctis luteolus]|nr:hypothetical protein HDU83_005996 [Entophlyctis luteolus]